MYRKNHIWIREPFSQVCTSIQCRVHLAHEIVEVLRCSSVATLLMKLPQRQHYVQVTSDGSLGLDATSGETIELAPHLVTESFRRWESERDRAKQAQEREVEVLSSDVRVVDNLEH